MTNGQKWQWALSGSVNDFTWKLKDTEKTKALKKYT